MDNVEKVKRHLAKPVPIVLKNEAGEEDTFFFKPLNVEQQAVLMEVSRRMKTRPMIKLEGIEVPDITKEDMKEMFDLILDITRSSMDGLDENTLVDFVNNNFDQLSDKLIDLVPKKSDTETAERLKKLKEKMQNVEKQKV